MNNEQITNSLGSLIESLSFNNPFSGTQISNVETLFKNNRWYMLSNMRQVLSQLYVEHGIVQTLVDQPVKDAFRTGYELKTDQISNEELMELEISNELDSSNSTVEQACIWNRLYGGAGIIIITDQDPLTPLEPLKKGDLIDFKSCDMWELFYDKQNINGEIDKDLNDSIFYSYYGKQIHHSRVLILKGKEAPSFIKPRLRGWGMSELERLVRSLNSYLKNQDLVFELLDEAKIDVYKMEGYNSQLLSYAGTETVKNRIQAANMIKNYQNAITMDVGDEYEQKQMNFGGLGEMLVQIRQGIAADLKMPITKLFGISTTGFNAGDAEIENYNSMVEAEVRTKVKPLLRKMNQLKAQALFGIDLTDLDIKFPPLRVMSAEQEENIKEKQTNRVISLFSSGLITAEEAKEAINKEALLPVEIDTSNEIGGY